MNKVCLLDYGSGNIGSVQNLLRYLNVNFETKTDSKDLDNFSSYILPGVGAFSHAVKKVEESFGIEMLDRVIRRSGKPFLGICVGMQVLADQGEEFGEEKGFGWISGKIRKIKVSGQTLPHIGWNNITIKKQSIFNNLNESDYYFANSYCFEPLNNDVIVAQTTYGEAFASIINQDNLWGVQFHPEKSLLAGQMLIKGFVNL